MVNKAEFAKKLRDAISDKKSEVVEREAFLRELTSTTSTFFEVLQNVGKEYEAGLTTIDLYEYAKILQEKLKKIFPGKFFISTPTPRDTYISNLGLEVTVNRSRLWLSDINSIIFVCVGGVSVDPALSVPDRE